MDDGRESRLAGEVLALRFIVNAMLKSLFSGDHEGRAILREIMQQLEGFSESVLLKSEEDSGESYLSGLSETIEEAFAAITKVDED